MKLPRKILTATMIVAMLVMLLPQVGLAQTTSPPPWDDCPLIGTIQYVAVAKWEWVGVNGSNLIGDWVYNEGLTSINMGPILASHGAPAAIVGWENAFNASWTAPGPIDLLYFKDGTGNDWWEYVPVGVLGDYFHFHENGVPPADDPPGTPAHPFDWQYGGVSHVTFCVRPDAVTLDTFTARASSGKVILEWKTALESDNAGFNLYRYTVDGGQLVKVNSTLIGAKAGGVTGAIYSFVDKPGAGTFYYYLEDVSTSGVTGRHGPAQVTVKLLLRRPVYRPLGPAY